MSPRWRALKASISRLSRPAEIKARYPFIDLDDIKGGLHDPLDGDIDPSQLTQAFAKGARDLGARIERFTRVTGDRASCRVANGASHRQGRRHLRISGQRRGLSRRRSHGDGRAYLPIVAMSHQYLVTEPIPELAGRAEKLPLLRDPDVSYYLRQERDGLLLGPYEWQATPHWLDAIPDDFAHQLYPDDLDRLESYIEAAIGRVPILGSVGVQRVINGPIPYSPDGNPYIGPAHGLTNFYQCCCFSFGIAQAGGAGKTLVGMDRRRRTRMGFLDLRSAPLHRLRDQILCRRQGDRTLSERIRDRLSAWRSARPAGPPRRRRSTTD